MIVFSVSFGVVGVPRVTGVVIGVFGDCGDGVGCSGVGTVGVGRG